jgi:hypothetical protein
VSFDVVITRRKALALPPDPVLDGAVLHSLQQDVSGGRQHDGFRV